MPLCEDFVPRATALFPAVDWAALWRQYGPVLCQALVTLLEAYLARQAHSRAVQDGPAGCVPDCCKEALDRVLADQLDCVADLLTFRAHYCTPDVEG